MNGMIEPRDACCGSILREPERAIQGGPERVAHGAAGKRTLGRVVGLLDRRVDAEIVDGLSAFDGSLNILDQGLVVPLLRTPEQGKLGEQGRL
jgi:hypothetical protein